jgi:cytidine deaminase
MQKQKYIIQYLRYDNREEIPLKYRELLDRAEESLDFSYAPYSNFRVGAAVGLENGEILIGSNQENAAYPMCLCAERSVLAIAAHLYPHSAPKIMAVVGAKKDSLIAPCGACRQVIWETEQRYGHKIELLVQAPHGGVLIFESVADLLPFGFSGKELR